MVSIFGGGLYLFRVDVPSPERRGGGGCDFPGDFFWAGEGVEMMGFCGPVEVFGGLLFVCYYGFGQL